MTVVPHDVVGPRHYRNSTKMLGSSDPVWQAAADRGLIGMDVDSGPGNELIVLETGHRFINMCSCSYLGLNSHPAVIQGAVDGLRATGATALSLSPTRIRPALAARLEDELADLWQADILLGLSCTALTMGILPLLASGHMAPDGEPRVMVFDRFCHFNMSYVKPICADESLVLTSPHNDLDFLEDVCRKYPRVAYVADGAYSMGGVLPLNGLLELQDKYGLFLYLDDSHALSAVGDRGEGYVRSQIEMNPLTVVVATLHKAFGTGGGVAMLGRPELVEFLQRHAGPVGWSQDANNSVIGASLASAALHRTPELGELQRSLRENVDLFDRLVPTPYAGNGLTVRVIRVGEAEPAVEMSAELFRRGFYSSAVFFPIVVKGEAGLRIMLRADLTREQIVSFAEHLAEVTKLI
ncbi:aminotransferase class I/II-fold pyridoxal phosphate-dependent enzyme [Streptomyces asiaticus]|uniref:aminotransferase class I/II-fold pyridoxal phosphate-dependent enzyme n=1 Tax=Streptomyces asiaticus TaxID=114695 RepID=UPI003F681071